MTTKSNLYPESKEEDLLRRFGALGFSASESQVYMTLLIYGKELGGTKLALLTKLHRQYVYLALPKLIESGLVEEIRLGKHAKYKARSPQEVEKIGRKIALGAGDLARELNVISNIGNEQEFEITQGTRAIQALELDFAYKSKAEHAEYLLGGASDLFVDLMGDALDEYLSVKTKRGISVFYIGAPHEKHLYDEYICKHPNQQYRFLEKLPKGQTHTLIRHDSVSFWSFLNPPLVYTIKSEVVAKNYKDFFMMLWDMAS